jgi:hypothetical protein
VRVAFAMAQCNRSGSERLRNRTVSYAINARAIMSNCVAKCTPRSRALLGRG